MHLFLVLKAACLAGDCEWVARPCQENLRSSFSWAINGGLKFPDGRPLFGLSKTIRGVLVSVLATTAAAPLLGLAVTLGAVVGSGAMAGDLFSSFVKRRLGFRSSSRATGLDQIPEALLPLIACLGWLSLGPAGHPDRRRSLHDRRDRSISRLLPYRGSRSALLALLK